MDVRVGLWRKLSAEKLMLLNCSVREDSSLESPLDCKGIKPGNSKGNQSWIFIGRTDAEAEAPILCTPGPKRRLIRKDPDAGKDWRQGEKGMTEEEMVGWHHWCNGQEFDQAPGVGDGQGSLTCCSPWGRKESDPTESDWITTFKKNFCNLCSWKILVCSFLSCNVFGLVSECPYRMSWEVFPPLWFFWKSLCKIGIISSFGGIYQWSSLGL